MKKAQLHSIEELPQVRTPHAVSRRQRLVQRLTLALAIVFGLVGLGLIVYPSFVHYQQDRLSAQLAKAFESGNGTIEIGADDWAVPGEESDTLSGTPAGGRDPDDPAFSGAAATDTPESTQPPEKITILAIARLSIPKIDLKMPIAEGATDASLRVAIGHYSPSVMFGENGQSILLGHRMYTYGRFFNRLDELAIDDQLQIETQTETQTWQVTQTEVVLPEELGPIFNRTYSEPHLLLVTCTPVRVADHRLLVTLKLVSREPIVKTTSP